MELISLLYCLTLCLDHITQRRLACIAEAILTMTGRVTMLGISRWTEDSGSYRTIQRFYGTTIPWLKVHWFFILHHLREKDEPVLIAGDEVVVPKAGKKTHGLDRFFSSLYGKPIPGLCFQVLSLISVKNRKSYPIHLEQVEKPVKDKQRKAAKPEKKRGRGRPKGIRNRNRQEVELSPAMLFLKQMLNSALTLIGTDLSLIYFVYDGALGNNNGAQMARQCGLHLISKLRYDAALYFPYDGTYSGRGAHKKYGKKLDYGNIPEQHLKSTETEDGIRTDTYQMSMRHKLFADLLNIVIIVKTNLATKKTARVVLFSSDLELPWDKLTDYYSLRFQIEFCFRDAKQYWGLDDFMNVKKQAVHNAANLSMFMVNLSHALRKQPEFAGMSVLDLKAWFRAGKYVRETLKLLPQMPEPFFIEQITAQVATLGRINQPVRSG